FVLLIAGGIGFIVFMQGNMGLSTLFDTGIKLAVAVTVIAVVAAVVLRKRLPRRLPLVIILLLFAGWIVGGTAFVLLYRNSFAPGQRETAKFYLPFMQIFDPPLPAPGSSLPTPIPADESGIAPEDLLGAP